MHWDTLSLPPFACRRIYMTIVAGAAVGVLGVEGWGGFIAYIISQLLVSIELQLSLQRSNYTRYQQQAWLEAFLWDTRGTWRLL
jgi:uncharacterized membrane protein